MICLDLHIHTIPSDIKNENFSFSINKLDEYISLFNIDAIAITNHDLFDINDYNFIKNHVNIKVFPGIEVDVESGHMLVISNPEYIKEFTTICSKINSEIKIGKKITAQDLDAYFSDKNHILFIPHYKKRPAINQGVINYFGNNIFCGEVNNHNNFLRLTKQENDLTPVLFSDCRFTENADLPLKQTYLDIDSTSFFEIKGALKDKTKVFINAKKTKDTFKILNDGTEGSTGLNIIIGKRSSGKTHTLNSIYKSFSNGNNSERIKYIRQFDLIEKEEETKNDTIFKNAIKMDGALFIDSYLSDFKEIVNIVQTINLYNEKKCN